MEWRIGCSGYHYPDWKGIFYPNVPQRKWFEYYCEHFNTVELNITYYKFPRIDTMRGWYGRSPEKFSFSVKAPRHITHFKKFRDAERMLSDFYEVTKAGLREKLACVLFQFPSNFHYDAERLAGILRALDTSVCNVLEFRHGSWWNPAVYDALWKLGVSFCGMSHPDLPEDLIVTSDTCYYRFHGVPHLYYSSYEAQRLEQVAHEVLNKPGIRHALVYFNNTAEGHAWINARQLQGICELVH